MGFKRGVAINSRDFGVICLQLRLPEDCVQRTRQNCRDACPGCPMAMRILPRRVEFDARGACV